MFHRAVDKYPTANPASQARNQAKDLAISTSQSHGVLKPSQQNTINKTIFSAAKNPLKRTSSQIERVPKPPARSMLIKSSSAGVLDQLHGVVDFDENDIDDFIDLDEEEPEPDLPVQYPKLPLASSNSKKEASQQSVNYPDLETQQSGLVNATPFKSASSIPLAWSSSPISHRLPPTAMGADDLKREAVTAHPASDSTQEPTPRPKKRRSLPWARQPEEVEADVEVIDLSKDTPPRLSKDTLPRPSNTPAAPSHPPWNISASAIKQEQSALRQKNAKSKKAAAKQAEDNMTGQPARASKGKRKMARVFLSDEQKMVLDLVVEKKESVFFTGSAGTGKSVLMREIIKVLRAKYSKDSDRVAVTASTGLAATNVSGVTLHSFAGIGLGKEPAEDLIKKIKKNAKARNRWLRAKVLIIDEISMVDGRLFDKLEKVARGLRNDGRPFGGIQLVVTGDFFQLPPVPDGGQEATFAFDAATWRTVINHTIGLTQVFRQKDPVFANMLNEMRIGALSQPSINAFHKMHRALDFKDSIEATELFPTRDEVDRSNRTRMQQLEGKAFTFAALDGGTVQDVNQRNKMLGNGMAPQSITLKKGAQVMLIKNLDDGLVNGSIGKVIAFMDEKTYDIYREDDSIIEPPDTLFTDGSAAEAYSTKMKDLTSKDPALAGTKVWPLVAFQLQDGTIRQLLCQQEKWTIELPNGEVQASRSQVPLILAWALSIHKAQGQTLERVKVDLGKVFEKGQAYVALSRATTQEGLQVLNFNPKKVMAHEKVRTFYDGLYNVKDTQLASKAPTAKGLAPNGWVEDTSEEDRLLLEYAHY